MPELNAKLDNFTASVIADATEEREQLLGELEAKRTRSLGDAETLALNDAYNFIKSEASRIRNEVGKRVSQHMMQNQDALYLRREEIAQTVFAQVEEKIIAFTQTPQYQQHLITQLRQVLAHLGTPIPLHLTLRPQDSTHAPALVSAAKGWAITVGEEPLRLGGLVVSCPQRHLRFDLSYDSALTAHSGHFAELFGLSLSHDGEV